MRAVSLHTRIDLDPGAPEPVSEQLRARLLELIRSGELPAGLRLPPVRRLATDLQIAANTVAKTYRALEDDGAVSARGRSGTFVADRPGGVDDRAARAATELVTVARRLGLTDGQIIELVRVAMAAPRD